VQTGSDEVDGVLVHHFPHDDEITHAMLAFGVGERDETLPIQGVLHALEHIVMDAVRRTPLEINAGVEASTTQFVASGSPDRVGDYLERLCAALCDPPVARLAAETPIIAAELATAERPEAPLLAARYGLQDLGCRTVEGPGPDGIRAVDVADMAARWFVVGNAVLVLDGPRPANLRLPLRTGATPDHHRPEPRRWPGPHAIKVDGPACMFSTLLPPQAPDRIDRLAMELISQRLTESLRHRDGLSYVVEELMLPSGARHRDLLIWAEPPPDRAVRAGQTMIAEMLSLLRNGPTTEELMQAKSRLEELEAGREAHIARVLESSLDDLLGTASFRPERGAHRAIEMGVVAGYLRALESDLLYVVSSEPRIDLDALGVAETAIEPTRRGAPPAGMVFVPPLLARVLSSEARQSTVVLEPGGISQRTGPDIRSIRWDGVAGLMEMDQNEFVLFGLDGTAIPIGSALYRGGQELIDAAVANIPPSLIYRRSRLLDLSGDEQSALLRR
jgi:hypothetical protein